MGRSFVAQGVANPVYDPNGRSNLRLPGGWRAGAGPGVIFAHGLGGDASQIMTDPWQHVNALTDAGFAVLGLDLEGAGAFGDASVVAAVGEGVSYLQNTVGTHGSKVGLQGWSMGGMAVANYMIRNPAKVACTQMWAPCLDMRWAHNDGGYVLPYAGYPITSGGSVPTAPATIDTAYSSLGYEPPLSSTTATAAVTVPASGGAGVTVPVALAFGFTDPTTKGSDARPSTVTIGGVLCTYTGIVVLPQANVALLGVVSTTGATVPVVNGTVVTTNYTSNIPGMDPMYRRGDFALGIPSRIISATNDPVVPPAMHDYFAAGAGASWSVLHPAAGGHSAFSQVSIAETLNVFCAANYT